MYDEEGTGAIGTGLEELEKAGYIVRRLIRREHGRITDTEYTMLVNHDFHQGG